MEHVAKMQNEVVGWFSWLFMVPSGFFMVPGWVFMVFHGSRSVFMVFHGSRLVFMVFSKIYPPEQIPGQTIQPRSAARRAA